MRELGVSVNYELRTWVARSLDGFTRDVSVGGGVGSGGGSGGFFSMVAGDGMAIFSALVLAAHYQGVSVQHWLCQAQVLKGSLEHHGSTLPTHMLVSNVDQNTTRQLRRMGWLITEVNASDLRDAWPGALSSSSMANEQDRRFNVAMNGKVQNRQASDLFA